MRTDAELIDALRACRWILAEKVKAAEAKFAKLHFAAEELLEVARLRGDDCLPNPCDDPLCWTSRMQTAWDDLKSEVSNG
jgi:hypothetical protein